MPRKIVRIPGSYYEVSEEQANKTVALMNRRHLMAGRVIPGQKTPAGTLKVGGLGTTRVVRMSKDFDVNRDKKIDNRDLQAGEIVGRTGKGAVKAKPKFIEVERHWDKNGRETRPHMRKNE